MTDRKDSSITIDAGHGGDDPGTVHRGAKEKDITLDYLKALDVGLREKGYIARTTRLHDRTLQLGDRASVANGYDTDIFISLHCDSYVTERPHGCHIFHYFGSEKGKKLAEAIFPKIYEVYKTEADRESKWSKIREANFTVLSDTKMPSILIEMGFLSNPLDRDLLLSDKYKQGFVDAVVKGLDKYFGAKKITKEPKELDDFVEREESGHKRKRNKV